MLRNRHPGESRGPVFFSMFKAWIPAFAGMTRAKRPFKLTKPGWIFILYTIGVGAGAINTGNNLLYLVFGVFLGLILASGFLSDLSLYGIAVEYTFPHAAQAGQPVSIFLNITNNKRWVPSLSAQVSMEGFLRNETVRLKRHVPFITARGTENTRLEWTPPMRGRFHLDHVRLSTRFPFSLLEKWWRLNLEEHAEDGFFITPKTVPLDLSLLPLRGIGEEESSEQNERGDGSVLIGLHAFAPGDNPRRIHWKSSAKRAPAFAGDSSTWLVREMNQDEKEEIVFVCPEGGLPGLSDVAVEQRASFLASAIAACRDAGYDTRLLLGQRLVKDEGGFLALWDPRKKSDPAVKTFLDPAPVFDRRSSLKWVDIEEAYRVGNAG